MGSPTGSAAIILFCCICVVVALSSSMAAAAPKKTPKFISMGALDMCLSHNLTKKAAPAKTTAPRKLIGVHHANANDDDVPPLPPGVCPVQFDHTRGISAVVGSCTWPGSAAARPGRSRRRCCGAFRTFACPYSDLLNDVNNGCANDMFYEIVVRGRVQNGLFSHYCANSEEGLKC